jgi:NAD(P)-dependent dehydrogenase (short-subunit alcohol dehydrogenase family)
MASLESAARNLNGGGDIRQEQMMGRFAGKVALVTGGGGGIGSAIACRLASEDAHVVVTDVNADAAVAVAQDIRKEGHEASAIAANIASAEECRELVRRVLAERGSIDVLVNNAGINRRGNIMALTEEDWSLTFAVNLDAMFHLCRAAIPAMIERGGGAIVNTASQWGLYPAPNHIAYNVSKAAVASFTQNLARDYAPYRIRVNAVCPGEIHTPMLEAGVKRSGRTIADLDRLVPFGRIGKPEEVAALVAFLASEEAPFMCGSLVEITGAQPVA